MMNNGYFVVGEFHSVVSEPWAKDPTKFNHRIILNNPYQDQYGNPQTEIIRVDVHSDDLPVLQKQAPQIAGKQVMIPVVCQARTGGRNGAWLSIRMPKESRLQFPKQSEKAA